MSLMMAFTPGRSRTGPAEHGPPPLARVESERGGGIRTLYFAPGASVKSAGPVTTAAPIPVAEIVRIPFFDAQNSGEFGYALNASRAASTVASTSMSVCAADVNAASNWL